VERASTGPHPDLLTRRKLLGTLLGLGSWPLLAAGPARELRVLTAPDPAPQRALLQALRQRHPNLQADADPAALDGRRNSLWLTLGPQALRRALEAEVHQPLVSVLSSSQAYRRQLATANREAASTTALFAEASPAAQMQLIAALFERRVVVGTLLSESSAWMDKPLRQAAQAAGLDVQVIYASPGQDPVRAINALNSAQVLLAVADGSLYTPDTLRAVLESTYRRGLPVIGFSAATVNAGTLACAHADQDDLAADLLELIDGLPSGNLPLPEARHPRYWRVAINDNVARSLGMPVTDRLRNLGNHPTGRPG
jgi:putative ABC transport system substrate-binding protein